MGKIDYLKLPSIHVSFLEFTFHIEVKRIVKIPCALDFGTEFANQWTIQMRAKIKIPVTENHTLNVDCNSSRRYETESN